MNNNIKIYIAGHNGMVGSACCRVLKNKGYRNIITKSSSELDLRNYSSVYKFIDETRPDVIIDAAAKVGGILANDTYPYDFLIENLQIQNNLISIAHLFDIQKFIFLGSSCIYPKFSKQPITEDSLLTGELESTNQWYAIAKITGVKLVESLGKQHERNYISLMPTNLYGINDNFDLNTSHVLPALIRKFHDAKINGHQNVNLWGTGSPLREFLFVDDLADCIVHAIENNIPSDLYNVGSGHELSIKKLALLIQELIGFEGQILWDTEKPDGTPRKLIDSSKIKYTGWVSKTDLKDGINITYRWFLNNLDNFKERAF